MENAPYIRISKEDIAHYQTKGFWAGPVIFTPEEIAALRIAHERSWRGDYDHKRVSPGGIARREPGSHAIRGQVNAFWFNDTIRKAVLDSRIGSLAAQLMSTRTVRLWHDQILNKECLPPDVPHDSGNVGWHQDYSYCHTCSTTNMVTAWIALQDTDATNGAMSMVVGSHLWGIIDREQGFHETDLRVFREEYSAHHAWVEELCPLKAGAVSFHHSLTLHASGPNYSTAPRLGVVGHYMPEGTAYQAKGGWHPNCCLLGPDAYDGQLFEGPCWPVVWQGEIPAETLAGQDEVVKVPVRVDASMLFG